MQQKQRGRPLKEAEPRLPVTVRMSRETQRILHAEAERQQKKVSDLVFEWVRTFPPVEAWPPTPSASASPATTPP